MFSSPAVRSQNQQSQENSQGLVARKPGALNQTSRKAFQDRDVNSKLQGQSIQKSLLKSKVTAFAELKPADIKKVDAGNDYYLDMFSFQDIKDSYDDIVPKNERFSKESISNTIKAFTRRSDTPVLPRKFESKSLDLLNTINIDQMYLDLPSPIEVPRFSYFEVDEEVPVPKIDFCDFSF